MSWPNFSAARHRQSTSPITLRNAHCLFHKSHS